MMCWFFLGYIDVSNNDVLGLSLCKTFSCLIIVSAAASVSKHFMPLDMSFKNSTAQVSYWGMEEHMDLTPHNPYPTIAQRRESHCRRARLPFAVASLPLHSDLLASHGVAPTLLSRILISTVYFLLRRNVPLAITGIRELGGHEVSSEAIWTWFRGFRSYEGVLLV